MTFWGWVVLWLVGLLAYRAWVRAAFRRYTLAWGWAHELCLALCWPAVLLKSIYDAVTTWRS